MRRVLCGTVSHSVKVTYLGSGKYGCRVYLNGVLNSEAVAESKSEIGFVCRRLLRMEDKCGNISNFASRARHRVGEKELRRKYEKDSNRS